VINLNLNRKGSINSIFKLITVISLILIILQLSSFALASEKTQGSKFTEMKYKNDSFNTDKYFKNFIDIPLVAVGEVFSSDKADLKRNLLYFGILAGSINYLDQDIRDYVQNNIYAGDNNLSKFLYAFGDLEYIFSFYGGGYLISKLRSDDYLKNTMHYSFQSLLITQAFTEFFKKTVNRDRPRDSKDDPFSRKGGNTFISGHASGTWATMTIMAKRYPKAKYLSYGMAAMVSASRIYEDAHWFSDVLAGSFVGYQIGNLTISLNDTFPEDISISPIYDGELAGLVVNIDI
jgi:hypothetical protein